MTASTMPTPAAPSAPRSATPVLEVRGLTKHFPTDGGAPVKAVDGIDLTVHEGETLSIVGESGCGKSTTARMLLGLMQPTSGSISFLGEPLQFGDGRAARESRRQMHAVFQDSFSSLDPRMTIAASVAEPLRTWVGGRASAHRARVLELLSLVGLPESFADRYPHQLSGGQRQRVRIARALALEPKLIVLDEPVSALDLSVQAQVVNLLLDLQERLGLAYVFIAHDLGVVRHISHRVLTMYLGRVVETGETDHVFDAPQHPYTRALISASFEPDPRVERTRTRLLLQGDPPSPRNMPAGCRFNPRCVFATDECRTIQPELEQADATRSAVACHHPQTAQFLR